MIKYKINNYEEVYSLFYELISVYNLYKDKYKVKINTDKGGIIDNVYIKESDKFKFELHLDRDDANAFLLKDNDIVEIIE